MNPTPTDLLDHTALNFSKARRQLAERVAECKAEQDALVRRHLRGIRAAASQAAQAEAQLRAHIEAHAELFVKPRTITLHGIKLGYQKGKGRITIADEGKTCDLIRKHLPDEADALIVVTEAPLKTALVNLDVATLRKLGCTVTGTDDQVVIKDTASEVDKLVAQLLATAAKATQKEDAA